jgi:hypothetical protein
MATTLRKTCIIVSIYNLKLLNYVKLSITVPLLPKPRFPISKLYCLIAIIIIHYLLKKLSVGSGSAIKGSPATVTGDPSLFHVGVFKFPAFVAFIQTSDNEARKDRYPNASKLAVHFELTVKSAQRNIDHFCDQLRAPLEYEKSQKGYYYTDPTFQLPIKGSSGIGRKQVLHRAVRLAVRRPWARSTRALCKTCGRRVYQFQSTKGCY